MAKRDNNKITQKDLKTKGNSMPVEKMKFLKPLVQKWKNEATKFSPYFEICAGFEEDEECPQFWITLDCKWVDRDGIVMPGLPKFEEK